MTESALRILLLEDNPVDARLFQALVRSSDDRTASIHTCDSFAGANVMLAADEYDVVVMNLGLKDLFGLEGLNRVNAAYPNLPIVVLTGTNDDQRATESLQHGAQDYIVKGVTDQRRMMKSIRHAIERKRHELERARSHEQMQRATRLESLGQLAAGMAHEINTPIQFIGDNTRFLGDAFSDLMRVVEALKALAVPAPDAEPVADELLSQARETLTSVDLAWLTDEIPKAIAQTLDGVGRVANIVRAMKQASHPGGNEKQLVQVNDTLQTAITLSRNEWKYHADLEREFDPELPSIEGFASELNQVFLNLIVNAAHAMADKDPTGATRGLITITTRSLGDSVEIRVRDTGGGIPESIRHKIFDPFFTTKEPGRGTGQGLSIAFNIVTKQHGGSIDFESEPGAGTTFIVTLPVRDPNAAATAAAAATNSSPVV